MEELSTLELRVLNALVSTVSHASALPPPSLLAPGSTAAHALAALSDLANAATRSSSTLPASIHTTLSVSTVVFSERAVARISDAELLIIALMLSRLGSSDTAVRLIAQGVPIEHLVEVLEHLEPGAP